MTTAIQSATLPVLQNGDTGEAVRLLQQLLITFNYLDKDQFDAKFGQNTKNAVIQFQRFWFGQDPSKQDGIVGPNTWDALGEAAKAKE
ncbi:peptidoglycan-binding domain-containing protein [Scytonema sp. PRP1]|uniref:peptidoglycan-binding domain-containing protein n=1 Tax=Scytonema sp. PRP1 TaxID=3120513 RepID=UPI002FCF97BA